LGRGGDDVGEGEIGVSGDVLIIGDFDGDDEVGMQVFLAEGFCRIVYFSCDYVVDVQLFLVQRLINVKIRLLHPPTNKNY
jgi:hypothetical protein